MTKWVSVDLHVQVCIEVDKDWDTEKDLLKMQNLASDSLITCAEQNYCTLHAKEATELPEGCPNHQ